MATNNENKKAMKNKYKLFMDLLIDNYEQNKKYLSQSDIERLQTANNTIGEIMTIVLNAKINELEKADE